jgi:hypothetical protein
VSRPRPNFLFIGPDKAGSTWLFNALRAHNQVYLAKAKELFFFDKFYERGWSWYERSFRDAGEQNRVIGEISHDYLFSEKACERIARELPSARLMVCLREPTRRAFSAYLYMVKQGRVRGDFASTLREVEELVEHGRYARYLKRYLELFPAEQVHVAIFDDLEEDPQAFFDSVCNFLGIERNVLPDDLKRSALPAARPRSALFAGLCRKAGWQLRRLGMPHVVNLVKNSRAIKRLLYEEYTPTTKPEIPPAVQEHLYELFAEEVKELDSVLGTNLYMRWGYPINSTIEEGAHVPPVNTRGSE